MDDTMNLPLTLFAVLLLPQQTAHNPQGARARALFQEMQTTYNAAKTLTFTQTTKVYSEKDGKKHLDTSTREQFKARRPLFFRMEVLSENPSQVVHHTEAVSDGTFVWNYDDQNRQYIKSPVGGIYANLFSSTGAPGSFFLFPEHSAGLLKPTPSITLLYLGSEEVAGIKCDKVEVHLASHTDYLPSSVQTYYIGADHLLRRLVGQMKIEGKLYITVIDIQSTEVNKELPDALFTFAPPSGATQKEMPNLPNK
jgi:outer membrane lipoprotein-sorting protein